MARQNARQNAMEAERTTAQKVWCVVSLNKYEDATDPYVSVFSSREKAMRCLEGAVEEDSETYGDEPRWNYDHTACAIGSDVVHRLTEQYVNA